MATQVAHTEIGDWGCTCTIQELSEKVVEIDVDLSPRGGALSSQLANYHSRLDVKLALDTEDLRAATSLTCFSASRGAGKSASAFAKFVGITIGEIRSVVIYFAQDEKRLALR